MPRFIFNLQNECSVAHPPKSSQTSSILHVGLRWEIGQRLLDCDGISPAAPVGTYWDSYETLSIMGFYQLVQDFFYEQYE